MTHSQAAFIASALRTGNVDKLFANAVGRNLTAHERRIQNVVSELSALCRADDPEWCGWCDNLKAECCCHLDPAGLPAGHWSLEGVK